MIILGVLLSLVAGCGDDGSDDPADTVAPVAGSDLTFSAVTTTGLRVSWGAASDDVTPPAELRYKVVRSSDTETIDTLAEVDSVAGTGLVIDFTAAATSTEVTGLTPQTTYAFAVVALDAAGNATLYPPAEVTTLATRPTVTITEPSSTGTFTTAATTVALAGTAADDVGVVSVRWANTANATDGIATGTTDGPPTEYRWPMAPTQSSSPRPTPTATPAPRRSS